ncbi:hypothetical protein SEVIR_8G227050v4 [Setaria viridis]|uniref:CASP-like protein n=1 Tax=Setaria viridis TaxID=4556 RepID=A0A4U6TLP2_SETVI|nr:CASP-like protein 1U1 [Setaria viridis]TKW02154.1 hypothetical protein SEVIR_8G227050v2 [Setaria viridis]
MADGDDNMALSLLLRIAALCLSVAAAVVMGTASDQVVIVDGDRRSSSYAVSYSQYNALKCFVAAAAISAACSAAALYLCAVRAAAAVGSLPLVPLLDTAAQAFLFSAAGAAFAARGAAGPRCSSSVCDAAGAFCGKVSVAAAAGVLAAVAIAVAALARDARRRRSSSSSSGGSSC